MVALNNQRIEGIRAMDAPTEEVVAAAVEAVAAWRDALSNATVATGNDGLLRNDDLSKLANAMEALNEAIVEMAEAEGLE